MSILEPVRPETDAVAAKREQRSHFRRVRGALYRDARWIALASLATAALGVAFWAVAAHQVPPSKLGVQTAMLAAVSAPAAIVASGVGDALIAVAGGSAGQQRAVVRHAYRLVLLYGVPSGAVAGVVAATVLPVDGSRWRVGALVFGGVLVWALFTIQDSALTSLGRTRWLVVENALAGVLKTVLLPLAVAVSFAVVWATLVPAAIAVVTLVPTIERLTRRTGAVDDLGAGAQLALRRRLSRLARWTTSSVALTLGALTFLPFVVTSVAGPAEGALFALALSIVAILDFVTGAVGTSLVVHGSRNRAHEDELFRAALRRTVPIVAGAGLLAVAASFEAFRLLDPAYLRMHAVGVITVLALTSVLRCFYVLWAAQQQARQDMRPVLQLNVVAAVLAYALVITTGSGTGAVGAAVALAAAQVVLSGGALIAHARGRNSGRAGVAPIESIAANPAAVDALPVPRIGAT